MSRKKSLAAKYPPSEPCACEICLGYCRRPGWWTVEEAGRAMDAGYSTRMMLEMAPDNTFGVLSPAFKGNEMDFARKLFESAACTFLKGGLCELHGTGFQPLECRHVHHSAPESGRRCHADVERDWNTRAGRELVVRWSKVTGFWDRRVAHPPQEDL